MNIESIKRSYQQKKLLYGPEVAIGSMIYNFRKQYLSHQSRSIEPQKSEGPNDNNLLHFKNPANKVTLQSRISDLKSSNKKKIAILFPAADHGTFRYRSYHVWQMLRNDSQYTCSFFFMNEISELIKIVDSIDLFINVRTAWNDELEVFINLLHQKNKKIVFDVDDLVFDLDYFVLFAKQLGLPPEEYNYWLAVISRNYLSLMKSDYAQTTNEFLAEKLRAKFDKKVFVFPNTVNSEQVEASEKLNAIRNRDMDENIRIGYFSGTNTHNKDFKLVEKALFNILSKHKNVRLRIVGHLHTELSNSSVRSQIEGFGLHNYIELQRLISECDISLIPLVENEFTNCKSELKYFDAGIVKVPCIASPTFIYKKIITDGKNGLLAKDSEWEEKISLLIENKQLRRQIGENAYTHSLENYYGKKVKKILLNNLDEMFENEK